MGLEAVEIVMEIEDTFGVKISDNEAGSCLTPGDLVDLVWSKVGHGDEEVCRSLRAFNMLRTAMMGVLGVQRGVIQLDTQWGRLAPRDARAWWLPLKNACGAPRWPKLRRPVWLSGLIGATAVFAAYKAATAYDRRLETGSMDTPAGAVAGIVVFVSLLYLTRPWRMRVPWGVVTVRDIVPYVQASPSIPWVRREQVAEQVRRIVIGQLGIPETAYSEDARFREDLGVG